MSNNLIQIILCATFVIVGFTNACIDDNHFFLKLITYFIGGFIFSLVTFLTLSAS